MISSIAHRIGFDTLADLKAYRDEHLKESDRIHDEMISYYEDRSVGQPFRLEVGDFVKGIGDINYLRNILQNGSVSKEYLGVSATSDFTPLDTDLSRFTKSSYSVRDMIEQSAANSMVVFYLFLRIEMVDLILLELMRMLEKKFY